MSSFLSQSLLNISKWGLFSGGVMINGWDFWRRRHLWKIRNMFLSASTHWPPISPLSQNIQTQKRHQYLKKIYFLFFIFTKGHLFFSLIFYFYVRCLAIFIALAFPFSRVLLTPFDVPPLFLFWRRLGIFLFFFFFFFLVRVGARSGGAQHHWDDGKYLLDIDGWWNVERERDRERKMERCVERERGGWVGVHLMLDTRTEQRLSMIRRLKGMAS